MLFRRKDKLRSPAETAAREVPIPGVDVNQCLCCKHLRKAGQQLDYTFPAGWRCEAFQDVDIPPTIVGGFRDHSRPYPIFDDYPQGDHGIMFEQAGDGTGMTWQQILDHYGAPNERPLPSP